MMISLVLALIITAIPSAINYNNNTNSTNSTSAPLPPPTTLEPGPTITCIPPLVLDNGACVSSNT